ncbi:UvrABC system protein A [bacterium HR11]|nr:UvrABC system protein A [bacterium HR11]
MASVSTVFSEVTTLTVSTERFITLQGVRHHNLKNLDLCLPKYRLIVVTGPSGSGKSSLAFETIYAEGQRRYLETLSTYARQFIRQMDKPDVERIVGLQPAVAIEQKKTPPHPRSTVGTVTEVYDYLRLLFARVGTPFCPTCDRPLQPQTIDQMVRTVLARWTGEPIAITAPIVRGRKGFHRKELEQAQKRGYTWARIDGRWYRLEDVPPLARTRHHTIDIVMDRLIAKPEHRARLETALETAIEMTRGFARVVHWENDEEILFSTHHRCPQCDFQFPDVEPWLFAFSSPKGACMACQGVGLVTPAVARRWERQPRRVEEMDADDPWEAWATWNTEEASFGGEDRTVPCPACEGTRLRPEARQVRIHGRNIADLSRMELGDLRAFLADLSWEGTDRLIAERILPSIFHRLEYLIDVGVEYLTLDRPTHTLSTGEMQRVRLAAQLGSGLRGVLYVLDEPTVGLHPRDTARLIRILHRLRDMGNTVIVVEHDEATIRAADFVVDLGPGAGEQGGYLIAAEPLDRFLRHPTSVTAAYLRGDRRIPQRPLLPLDRVPWLRLRNVRRHNLAGIDVQIPLGRLTAVTGVSGSGKSTLVFDVIYEEITRYHQSRGRATPLYCDAIEGLEFIRQAVVVDQSPVGRTPRSTPATYIGVFDDIRKFFASQPTARVWGYSPGRFSFNRPEGRCHYCEGMGYRRVRLHFMPDAYVLCEDCGGDRYNADTLKVTWQGRSIADILKMTVDEALQFFQAFPSITRKLQVLSDLALGYLRLGQPSHTLSGGESQRLKLARELTRSARGGILYLLDEPTTGLHAEDIRYLLQVLNRLVEQGHTVVVIEHHPDVIRNADYVLDLGPGGGRWGGRVVACGPPPVVAACAASATGQILKSVLQADGGKHGMDNHMETGARHV